MSSIVPGVAEYQCRRCGCLCCEDLYIARCKMRMPILLRDGVKCQDERQALSLSVSSDKCQRERMSISSIKCQRERSVSDANIRMHKRQQHDVNRMSSSSAKSSGAAVTTSSHGIVLREQQVSMSSVTTSRIDIKCRASVKSSIVRVKCQDERKSR